ncbi:hypothetical protein K3A10_004594 [Escherichia albertii]|nr:hypothetical protein [Escherichia albertii]
MSKMKSVLILLSCLLLAEKTMAHNRYTPGNQSFNVNESFGVTDSGAVSGDWLKLSQLKLNTVRELTDTFNPCSPFSFLCTGASISLDYNGKANYNLKITRYVATITDDSGNNYMFTLAFPESSPVIGIYEHNDLGGRKWNTFAAIDNSFKSLPDSQQDIANASAPAQGYCGRLGGGCEYSIGAYIHDNSGMPYLYIKLPKNISARNISFTDIKLLEFNLTVGNKAGSTMNSVTAKLYLSGTVSVPQRCYIKADKNSFDFGTVYSNANNGAVKNVSTSITTDCYNAPVGTTQFLKIGAVSGGSLNNRGKVYQVASDPALGIVFNINNYSLCEPDATGRNFFEQEYLMGKVFTQQQHQTSTDTINFSLCKYGLPAVTGQKNVVLKLTSRWVVN